MTDSASTSENTAPAYVAVDWGTTSFRLWLLSPAGTVLGERRSREGMTTGAADNSFAKILASHLDALKAPADIPVVICGMAGARQGWMEAGYIDLPASLPAIFDGSVKIAGQARDIRILPGLAQRNTDHPDVMRGEETQLVGALSGTTGETQIVCMPGTHSKWVQLSGDKVERFSTFMTGELFDVISTHSVLSHSIASAKGGASPAFLAAVSKAFHAPESLTNLLFTVRSGQLLHGVEAEASSAALSGYLLGAELAGGLALAPDARDICLVATGPLKELYEAAFSVLDIRCQTVDADIAVRRGLFAAAQHIFAQI